MRAVAARRVLVGGAHTRHRQGETRMRAASGPSPAMVVALIALVAALAGTATALPGKNSVDKNDIKKNAVKSKNIKKGQVKSSDIADGAVAEADLTPAEDSRLVGAPGEPAFGDGGEGDCEWRNVTSADTGGVESGLGPLSFYRDPYGAVRIEGTAVGVDAAGGDGVCDPSDPGEAEDGNVFELPAGYRPTGLIFTVIGGSELILIAPDAGATFPPGLTLGPGAVLSSGNEFIPGSISFRAASAAEAAASADGPAPEVDLEALRKLAR